jgi:predicted lipoprotein with Yx(FWY)xxD motif
MALPGVRSGTRPCTGEKPCRPRDVLVSMRIPALLPALAVCAALAACGGGSDAGTSDAVVSSAKKAKVGSVLVDAQGRTLYRFTAEAQGLPVCTGACLGTWRPALAAGTSGLPEHVATVRRPDGGKLQLTYDGHPLYRYAGDRTKADANGEGVGGQWYVIKH